MKNTLSVDKIKGTKIIMLVTHSNFTTFNTFNPKSYV